MYISFVASPLMKYAFFASLDEINGIFIPKIWIYSMYQTHTKHILFCYTTQYPLALMYVEILETFEMTSTLPTKYKVIKDDRKMKENRM